MVFGTGLAIILGYAAYTKAQSSSTSDDKEESSKKPEKADKDRLETRTQLENIERLEDRDHKYWAKWATEHPEAPDQLPRMARPLRLLSFDGGGVRGIISLLILQNIMEQMAPGGDARPCDYFDLIGGTSTGGLIAVMLGRLRMSIPECIDVYSKMSQNIFDVHSIEKYTTFFMDGHLFDGERLKRAVEDVVEKYRGTTSTAMWDDRDDVCRSFVVAIPGCGVPRGPKLFRSYDNPFQQRCADRCGIWEAARATACAPSFFDEIRVEDVLYSDGGMGYNNPTRLLIDEARSLWGFAHPIGCIISLGTGHIEPVLRRFKSGPEIIKIFKVFGNMATDCERVHQEVLRDRHVQGVYHRFNPTLEKDIGLDEWARIPSLKTIAQEYLQRHQWEVAMCALALSGSLPKRMRNFMGWTVASLLITLLCVLSLYFFL